MFIKLEKYALTACDDLIVGPDRCTYVNEALGHSSCIDHFFVSVAVRSAIKCISIVDSAVNNSDHRPVLLDLDSSFCLSPTSRNRAPVSEHEAYNIRWDRGHISAYYGLSGCAICDIQLDW